MEDSQTSGSNLKPKQNIWKLTGESQNSLHRGHIYIQDRCRFDKIKFSQNPLFIPKKHFDTFFNEF